MKPFIGLSIILIWVLCMFRLAQVPKTTFEKLTAQKYMIGGFSTGNYLTLSAGSMRSFMKPPDCWMIEMDLSLDESRSWAHVAFVNGQVYLNDVSSKYPQKEKEEPIVPKFKVKP